MVTTQRQVEKIVGFTLDRELAELASRVEGDVLLPGNSEYDVARKTANIMSNRYPFVIVRATAEADVAEAVRFATTHGLPISVRSGGHSLILAGVVDDAVTIDFTLMKAIRIDPVSRTARVQPGVNSGELGAAANPYGLALTTGDAQSVGLGGLVSGGGIGFMVRKYGLSIDSLLSARVVTADGEIRTASAVENPDLFWAIRGGGGNFGVITEFTFRMAPVGDIYGGELILPATPEVVRGYLDLTLEAPEELTIISNLLHLPPFPHIPEVNIGKLGLQLQTVWVGDPADGPAAMAPFRALAEPLADALRVMPYPDIYKFTEHYGLPHSAAIRSSFFEDFSDDAIQAMLDAIAAPSSPFALIQLRGLGGAFGQVDRYATAFPHRDARYFLAIIGLWMDPSEDPKVHQAWTGAIWDKVKSEANGVYVNFLEAEGEERIREAYLGETYKRLQRIKAHYDPTNVFRNNQNITPEQ